MNRQSKRRGWFLSVGILLLFLTACGGGAGTSGQTAGKSETNQQPGPGQQNPAAGAEAELKYIASTNVVVKELWLRDGDGVESQVLSEPKTIKFKPAEEAYTEMFADLSISPGEYDQVRIVFDSGEVQLSKDVYLATGLDVVEKTVQAEPQIQDPFVFSTEQGRLIFPAEYKSGVSLEIKPPLQVVSAASPTALAIGFNFDKSVVFNSPSTQLESLSFKPALSASGLSSVGRVSIRNLTEIDAMKCEEKSSSVNAVVTAIDTSRVFPIPRRATTDSEGNAQLTLLRGKYDIRIQKVGFETVTLRGIEVLPSNVGVVLKDLSLVKDNKVVTNVFNLDVAKLLTLMSNVAYDHAGLTAASYGDDLKFTGYDGRYPDSMIVDDYIGKCWKFVKYVDKDGFAERTQFFVAINKKTDDIVVGFQGTSAEGSGSDLFWDYVTNDILSDVNMRKVGWQLRIGDETNWHDRKGKVIFNAMHNGFKNSYLSIAQELKDILDDEIKDNVRDPASSRVYFTGHSLGAGIAGIAAMDFTNYLQLLYGYKNKNIMMYGIAMPRTFTTRMKAIYQDMIPNGFAVVAKDDLIPYIPGIYDGLGESEYTHLEQLVVLSTNILDYGSDVEQYQTIGQSRLEYSYLNAQGQRLTDSKRYGGCQVGILSKKNVGFFSAAGGFAWDELNVYAKKGHDQINYLRRLETLAPGDGEPVINIDRNDVGSDLLKDWKLRLNWHAGVQGPCDWVGLYHTTDGNPPTDASKYLRAPAWSWQWVVRMKGEDSLADDAPPVPSIASRYTTYKNPYYYDLWDLKWKVEDGDFWVGYVDGFNNIIKYQKWTKLPH